MAVPARRKGKSEVEAWDPFGEFSVLQDRMSRLFDQMMPMGPSLRLLPGVSMEALTPDMEIYETAKEVVAKAHVPGVDKKNLDVTVDDDSITIKGEMRQSEESKAEDYYLSEISYGRFSRTMPFASQVDSSKAKAKLDNGVLEVRVPKSAAEKAKTKKVAIT